MLIYFFFAFFLILAYFAFIRTYIKLIKLKLQYGDKAVIKFFPLTGDFAQIQKSNVKYGDGLKHFQQRVAENPNIKFVLSNLMHEPLIEIYDPEYYKEIFLNHDKYQRLDILYHEKLTSRGILYSEGEKWKNQRSVLGVPFTFEKLKERIPTVNQVVKQKLKDWNTQHIYEFLGHLTSEIVMKSFFGASVFDQKINGKSIPEEILDLDEVMAAQNLFNPYVVLKRLIFGRKGDKIFPSQQQKILNKRVDDLIEFIQKQIDAKLDNSSQKGNDFFDIYVEAFKKQTETKIEKLEICSMFVTLFAAGSGTSVHSIAMILYFLGQEQEAQEEIRQQVTEIMGAENDVKDSSITKLTKLNAFIQEMFRFKAPLFGPFIRKAKTTHFIKDLKIEKGSNVLVLFAAPGWSSKYYKNPEIFDYKRWLEKEIIKEDNGFVYIPFSAGGRNCIGQHMALMNMKVILCHILKNFRIKLDPNIKVRFPINFQICVEPENIIQFERII